MQLLSLVYGWMIPVPIGTEAFSEGASHALSVTGHAQLIMITFHNLKQKAALLLSRSML